MPSYKIAHIRVQSVDLIIVPMGNSFHFKSIADKNNFTQSFQSCARNAGLAGTVVPVWNNGNAFNFLAPNNIRQFFRSIDMNYVLQNINKKLTCY